MLKEGDGIRCDAVEQNNFFSAPKSQLKIMEKWTNLWPIKLFLPGRHFLCICCARAAFVRVVGHKNAIPSAKDVAPDCVLGRLENDGSLPQILTACSAVCVQFSIR